MTPEEAKELHLTIRGSIPSTIDSKPEYSLMAKEMDETLEDNKRRVMAMIARKFMKAGGKPSG